MHPTFLRCLCYTSVAFWGFFISALKMHAMFCLRMKRYPKMPTNFWKNTNMQTFNSTKSSGKFWRRKFRNLDAKKWIEGSGNYERWTSMSLWNATWFTKPAKLRSISLPSRLKNVVKKMLWYQSKDALFSVQGKHRGVRNVCQSPKVFYRLWAEESDKTLGKVSGSMSAEIAGTLRQNSRNLE